MNNNSKHAAFTPRHLEQKQENFGEVKGQVNTKVKICQLDGAVSEESDVEYDNEPLIIKYGKRNAKRHGIKVTHGRPNPAKGNCAFEAVLFNIFDRKEYSSQQKVQLSVLEARKTWITEIQTEIETNRPYLVPDNLKNQWSKIIEDGVYEIPFFGDLVMNAIGRGSKNSYLYLIQIMKPRALFLLH